MTLVDIKLRIQKILMESGIMVDSIEEDFDMRDVIQDSIQFISFIVNLEEDLEITVTDELLSYDAIASYDNFCKNIYDLCNE